VPDDRVPEVRTAVEGVAAGHRDLRVTGGKKILELRPNLDWDKGRALSWLLEVLGLDRTDVVPVYVGDDDTDEDAFRAIRDRGIGVVVRGEADDRPTAAHYQVGSPAEAARFLEMLASLPQDGGT
jgi:alpha,alpha-trehalase